MNIKNNWIAELTTFLRFVAKHVFHLPESAKKYQGATWRQVLHGVVFFALAYAAIAALTTPKPVAGDIVEWASQTMSLFSLFVYTAIWTVASISIWAAILGALLKLLVTDFDWDSWIELFFFSLLPTSAITLIATYYKLNISLSWLSLFSLVSAAANFWGLWILYKAAPIRFNFLESSHKPFKIGLLVIACASLLSTLSTLKMSSDISRSFSRENSTGRNKNDAWKPDLPSALAKKVRALYPHDKVKQRAAMQFANATWYRIGPDTDPRQGALATGKAIRCLLEFDMEYKPIKKIVLYNTDLVLMSDDKDRQVHGMIFSGNEYGKPLCE